ncbi:MAG: hypothetical protein AAF431_05110 [Pseudomonadota bacterium]
MTSANTSSSSLLRNPWLACLLLGLAVLAFGPYLLAVFPQTGAGYNSNLGTPVFAFEFARTQADLLAIFGDPNDALRAERIAAMDTGHYLDFIFAVLYSGFLAYFFVGIRTVVADPIYRWVTVLCVVAGAADVVENLILLDITRDIEQAPLLPYLIIPVQIKFICLTIATIAACWLFISRVAVHQGKWYWRGPGALGLVTVLLVIPGLVMPTQFGYLVGGGYTVGWVTILVYAAVQVWSQRSRA